MISRPIAFVLSVPAGLAGMAMWGCLAAAPDLPGEDDILDPGSPFVDMVLSATRQGQVETCGGTVAVCEEPLDNFCSAENLLGAPDGITYPLAKDDNIVVAFRCSIAREVGVVENEGQPVFQTADFTIWSTVPEGILGRTGPYPVVEVSDTGLEFQPIGCLGCSNQSFDLARTENIEIVKFIRISGANVNVEIDAIEALNASNSLSGNIECPFDCVGTTSR